MQLARLVGGVGILWASAALAAQGDALLVTGSNVNVRAGPSIDAGILTRVGIDEPAIEQRRQGEWVEVELPDQDVLGWIHGSLLITAPDPPATEQAQDERANAEQRDPAAGAGGVAALDVAATDAARSDAAATDAGAAAAPGEQSEATPLGRFRRDVAYFNERAVAAAGVDLFTGVVPRGEGAVQVVTTAAWATMSEPGQKSYLNALFGRWQAAAGEGRALRVEIVDADGALMMEKSGP